MTAFPGALPRTPPEATRLWTPAGNSFPAPFWRFPHTPRRGYEGNGETGVWGMDSPVGCRGSAPAGSLRVNPSDSLSHDNRKPGIRKEKLGSKGGVATPTPGFPYSPGRLCRLSLNARAQEFGRGRLNL